MRLGVLDIGSNTGHLLVVDAHGGAAPLPASSHKQPLRLAEHLDEDGAVTKKGIKALTDFCASATQIWPGPRTVVESSCSSTAGPTMVAPAPSSARLYSGVSVQPTGRASPPDRPK